MYKLKKSLGQNLLIDKNVIKKILSAANLENQIVFEIGPGKVLAGTVKRTIPDANVLSVGLAPQIDQALEMIND